MVVTGGRVVAWLVVYGGLGWLTRWPNQKGQMPTGMHAYALIVYAWINACMYTQSKKRPTRELPDRPVDACYVVRGILNPLVPIDSIED